ncbi:urease accessory UreF family protein [Variovorax sp. J22P168]|uniref:urease accessory protein UreF n=1 Tax=Variovorax jilinensis TaxID=3053513 RepID=UPI002574D5E6|nr:urease accessory UreF family protein [Variovorax sp. J22P168]MDM0015553.1 urease accessory UreF family protein [Variovorax sp. J22P168]
MATTTGRDAVELMRVLQFGDSTLPVGAFSFSNGVESAIQTGIVRDLESLKGFVLAAAWQSAQLDGVALLAAHRAALRHDLEGVIEADNALMLRRVGDEQRLMSTRMGKKLAQLGSGLFDDELLVGWLAAIADGRTPGSFPVAHGLMFAAHALPEEDAFAVHQYGVTQMMLGAALRLMRVDHLQTQKILFDISAGVHDLYVQVRDVELDEMTGFAPVFDVLVAHHVGAHVRMFMN